MMAISIGATGVVYAQDWERATKAFRSAAVTARTSPGFLRCNDSLSFSSTMVRNQEGQTHTRECAESCLINADAPPP